MEDLIKREDALKELRLDHKDVIYIDKNECARRIKAIPSADRPSGEVDAVKEYERQVHNLNQGYITLGEFDKRIEPLRHLYYDRPSGEWIPCSERLPSEQGQYLVTFLLCNGDPWVYVLSFCKGKFYETDDEWGDVEYDDVTAWMPLPEPWKGADDEDN